MQGIRGDQLQSRRSPWRLHLRRHHPSVEPHVGLDPDNGPCLDPSNGSHLEPDSGPCLEPSDFCKKL